MIYDVSMLIHEDIQVYKNKEEKKPIFKTQANHKDDQVHETQLTFNLHTGTHVDFPLHMIAKGKTSDTEEITNLIGSCKVLDMTKVKTSIGKEELEKHQIEEDDFLFFKTRNSDFESFLPDFVYLNEEGAKYLKSLKVRGVGTDGLGIERNQKEHPTHKILLENDIIIIEGLRLKDVPEKTYDMVCLPLKIKGVEALPARVILLD
jgi:arylformamidase